MPPPRHAREPDGPGPRHAILRQINEGVIMADREGRITFVNEAARRMHGVAELDVPVERYSEVYGLYTMDGAPYPAGDLPLARALRGQAVERAEWRIRRADGTEIIAEGAATPLYDENGEQTGAVIAIRDITERHRLERQLDAERARLHDILMQAPAFIAVLHGPDHVFQLANPQYQHLVGRRDLNGQPLRDALPELEAQGYPRLLDAVYETGEPFVGTEMRILFQSTPDEPAREHFVTFVYLPLREHDGSISGLLMHGIEVTEHVRARERMEELYRQADAASRAKSDFLAVMSHELRTPLTGVIGHSELLLAGVRGEVNEEQKEQIRRIQSSAWHLVGIIDEILTFSRTEAGREELRQEDVEVKSVVLAALADVAPVARSKGLTLDSDVPDDPVRIRTDPVKLRQIVGNLLANAVKFTREGGVTLKLRADPGEVVLHVTDTGIGIAPEHLARIFEPFWQVQQGMTRTEGGTGLGLTISRRLAHLLGGDLIARSEVGRGSTFTLRVPVSYRPPQSTAAQVAAELSAADFAGRALAPAGRALNQGLETVVRAWSERLRQDPAVSPAAALGRADLEDHVRPFITDMAQALVALEEGSEDTDNLLRDGSEIQRVIAHLHGRQRARLGWSTAAVAREYAVLREEIEVELRAATARGAEVDVATAMRIIIPLLQASERISIASLAESAG